MVIKVMVADDQALIRESLKIILSAHPDIEVVATVEDGNHVLSSIPQTHPDLILMDIRMPVMSGLEAARQIRAMSRTDAQTVPIIAMTANAYEEDVSQSLAAGMNAHLAKPIEPQVILDTLAGYIGSKN